MRARHSAAFDTPPHSSTRVPHTCVHMGKKAGSKKSAAPAAVPPPKPVHERGALWQAEKLTGDRNATTPLGVVKCFESGLA